MSFRTRLRLTCLLGAMVCLGRPAHGAAQSAADSTAVVAVLAALDGAWRAGDVDGWVAHYAADARFINIGGQRYEDRAAITARFRAIFQGAFRGSRRVGTLRHLRWLGPDAALVEEDIEITRFRALPSGIQPSAPGVLRTRMRHVLERRAGRWLIVASQNTAVAPAP